MWHKFVAFSCPQPHACASTDTGPDRLGQGKMRPPDAAERQCALQNPITALPAKPGGTPFSRKPKLLRTLFCGIRTWAPSMWDSAVPANSAKLRHAAAARHRMLTRQARGPASKIAASIRRLSACGCARFTPPSLAAWQQREDRWALATSAATHDSMTRYLNYSPSSRLVFAPPASPFCADPFCAALPLSWPCRAASPAIATAEPTSKLKPDASRGRGGSRSRPAQARGQSVTAPVLAHVLAHDAPALKTLH